MALTATEQTMVDWVKRRLGHPVVKVELSDDMYADALDEAKRWYTSHQGAGRHEGDLQVSVGLNEYAMPAGCQLVYDVAFEDNETIGVDIDGDGWIGASNNRVVSKQRGSFSSMYLYLQYAETIKWITGAERSWFYIKETNKLIFAPNPATSYRVKYWYMTEQLDCAELMPQELQMVRDYTLAEAMWTLGMIRTKYASVPSATGEMTLNGDTLLGEASAMRDRLETKVKLLRTRVLDHMHIG